MNANSDLIFRSALLEEIEGIYKRHYEKSCYQFIHDFFKAIFRRINKASAVDAVVLPVHVQQIVYADLRPWETTLNVQPFMVTCITVTQNKKGEWTKKFRANWFKDGKAVYEAHDFWFDEIGNKVFLTREEAEAVLGRTDDA